MCDSTKTFLNLHRKRPITSCHDNAVSASKMLDRQLWGGSVSPAEREADVRYETRVKVY